MAGRIAYRQLAGAVLRWLGRAGVALSVLAGLTALGVSIAVYAFPYPVERLDPGKHGPLIVTDRRGEILRVVPADDGRRSPWVSLDRVPALATLTFLASEDENFFEHDGVDPEGVMRAAYLNVKERRVGYGGSTITMQLVRMLHSRGEPRTWSNKVAESILAMRLERAVDKRTILEQYVNRAYFGNNAHGIEAAAQRYFDKPAAALSVSEATLLAVIPRAPTGYDPLRHLDRALKRREHIFSLLTRRGLVSRAEVDRARAQPLEIENHEPPFLAPHFTDWILRELPEDVRRQGGTVTTTLDLDLHRRLEHRVREHVAAAADQEVRQAGAIVLDTESGAVLAMIGSPGFDTEDGQLNIATWRRHPGSALKPFVYALAIEHGDNPATVAYDVRDAPSEYSVHDHVDEHGPMRYREALAGSYNLAAVHTLEKVGVERLMSTLRRARVGKLDLAPDQYGLRLALGSARVRLLDLAAAYSFLVRDGKTRPAYGVVEVLRSDGSRWLPASRPDVRLFTAETAFMVMDMLADPNARRPRFGDELALDLPWQVAAKTGTARGFADTVAIGVTSEYTVAGWAGNFDGRPTRGVKAMEGAAPLVRAGLLLASDGRPLTLPKAPADLVRRDVCALSGLTPTHDCPHRKSDYFHADSEAPHACDWHVRGRSGRVEVQYPAELEGWARRQRRRGGRHLSSVR